MKEVRKEVEKAGLDDHHFEFLVPDASNCCTFNTAELFSVKQDLIAKATRQSLMAEGVILLRNHRIKMVAAYATYLVIMAALASICTQK